MNKRYISAKDLSKKLENLDNVNFAYTVTDYYVTFKMSKEMFDDLNNAIKGKSL